MLCPFSVCVLRDGFKNKTNRCASCGDCRFICFRKTAFQVKSRFFLKSRRLREFFDGVFPAELILKTSAGFFRARIGKEQKRLYTGNNGALKAFHQHDRPPKGINKKVAIASA